MGPFLILAVGLVCSITVIICEFHFAKISMCYKNFSRFRIQASSVPVGIIVLVKERRETQNTVVDC